MILSSLVFDYNSKCYFREPPGTVPFSSLDGAWAGLLARAFAIDAKR